MADSPFAIFAKYQTLPVDVDGIARELGLAVYKINLGAGISAQLVRDRNRGGSSGFAAYVDSSEHPNRQRFSLAHEIAHYVLHRDLIEDGVTDDTMYRSAELSGFYEVQANRMAADILMPIRLLKREYQYEKNVQSLARKFGVSPRAMEIRLKAISST